MEMEDNLEEEKNVWRMKKNALMLPGKRRFNCPTRWDIRKGPRS
jgi:hypothetical protein